MMSCSFKSWLGEEGTRYSIILKQSHVLSITGKIISLCIIDTRFILSKINQKGGLDNYISYKAKTLSIYNQMSY